jgi:hypothetical protein
MNGTSKHYILGNLTKIYWDFIRNIIVSSRLIYKFSRLVDIVVMGDVFPSLYNFHVPLSSKVDLPIHRICNISSFSLLYLYIRREL